MDQLAYEEIDLRVYVLALLRNWYWIALATVACATAAFIVSLLLRPTYEASALVAIMDARYTLQLDPRFETSEDLPSYRVYTDLAASDDVLQGLWQRLSGLLVGMETWHSLRGVTEAESGSDNSLLRLTVQLDDPEMAARLANTWAEILVARVNAVYGSSDDDVVFARNQLALAETDLAEAEASVVDFQSSSELAILENQLSSRLAEQNAYLRELREIDNLRRDIGDLRTQLWSQPSGYRITFGDRLTALSLQVRSFNAQSGIPIQLQVTDPEALSSATLGEQVSLLNELTDRLTDRASVVESALDRLEPQILELQQRVELARTERDRLTRARDLARDTYALIARKLTESEISAADDQGRVVLASLAAAPDEPSSPSKVLNTAIGATVGGLLSTLAVFAIEWWRQGEDDT